MEKLIEEEIENPPSAMGLSKKGKSTLTGIDRFTVDNLIKELKSKGNLSKGTFKDLLQKVIPILSKS